MRTAFIGAVEGSAVALLSLCDDGQEPDLVVTLPLEKAGSHSDFADLGPIAQAHGIALHRTARSDDAGLMQTLTELRPDLIMIIGWSQLVGAEMMALPRLGVLGFHPAPLPRMRGRAVIPWQILTGQRQGGATLFWIGEGVDDGPIAAQALFDIDPETITARQLYDRSVSEMATMLPPLLRRIATGDVPATQQDHAQASLCARRRPEDGRIDWTRPAAEIERLIRAVGPPYPGATTTTMQGDDITITRARLHPRGDYFVGMPGQVQEISDDFVTVMCGDGQCLDLLAWQGEGTLGRHSTLGRGL
ncbi:methionyl-tRNA formyltransferase [Paracoccus xiamenensis]|uniref:methionyl-tRNA formyltransferase n=1 Tax=Paracoccus xiamenensis TaxID=2714901 RepID=UPI00140E3652|nr:formyltransferase family protein [Paracoccus xiamenensis]NHF73095.1 methionyl-tRNA formyltransferase [Paracoccus xiamenensis]